MKYKLIMFDMDGTLIDSWRFHVDVYHRYMSLSGFDVTREVVADAIGATVKNLFYYFEIPEEEHERYYSTLEVFYQTKIEDLVSEIPIVDGAYELLDGLSKSGYPIALVTNSLQQVVDEILREHDLNKYFKWIRGADRKSRDKVSRCQDVQLLAGVDSKEVLYVGDTSDDMDLANRLGYDSCFTLTEIAWHQNIDEIEAKYRPTYVVNYLTDLLALAG